MRTEHVNVALGLEASHVEVACKDVGRGAMHRRKAKSAEPFSKGKKKDSTCRTLVDLMRRVVLITTKAIMMNHPPHLQSQGDLESFEELTRPAKMQIP